MVAFFMKEVLEEYLGWPFVEVFRKCKAREYICNDIRDFETHRENVEATNALFFTSASQYNGLAIVNFTRSIRAVADDESSYIADISGNIPFSLGSLRSRRGNDFYTEQKLVFALFEKKTIPLAGVRGLYDPSSCKLIVCDWSDVEIKEGSRDPGFGIPDHWGVS